jgi:hypothetical protein
VIDGAPARQRQGKSGDDELNGGGERPEGSGGDDVLKGNSSDDTCMAPRATTTSTGSDTDTGFGRAGRLLDVNPLRAC